MNYAFFLEKLLFCYTVVMMASAWNFVTSFEYDRPLKKLGYEVFQYNQNLWKMLFGCVPCMSFWYTMAAYWMVYSFHPYSIFFAFVSVGIAKTIYRID